MARKLQRILFCAMLIGLWLIRCVSPGQVVINEIMYNPPAELGSDEDYEFIELFNSGDADTDISGWQLEGTGYTFPEGAVVPAQGFLVLCRNPQAVSAYYGIANVYGPYPGALENDGEELLLLDNSPTPLEMDILHYLDGSPWPTEADGDGSSLELLNPRLDNAFAGAWAASSPLTAYGTPGKVNSVFTESIPPIISLVSRTPQSPTSLDQVNVTATILDDDGIMSAHLHFSFENGFMVTEMRDDGNSGDGQAGDGVFGGFISVQADETLVKFYIVAEDTSGATSSLPYGAPETWYCFRVEDSPIEEGDVVINEIMYNNPFLLDVDNEWVELYNTTDHTIDISCWSLRDENDSHSFVLPEDTVIPSRGYLVVCRDVSVFQLQYGTEYPGAVAVGGFTFNLGDGNDSVRVFNANGVLIDIVDYRDDLPWPEAADGLGASMECADPTLDNDLFSVWGASLEPHPRGTPGQQNTVYSPDTHYTDLVINEIMYHPFSAEQKEKFIEIVNVGQEEISLNGWQLVGEVSFRFPDTATILPGEYVVVAADLTWMLGKHDVGKAFGNFQGLTATGGQEVALSNPKGVMVDYVDFKDNDPWPILPDGEGPSLELINPYDDNDFGRNWADGSPSSPGQQNSAFTTNNAPYITKAKHSPHEPKDSDSVVITAKVRDADGLLAVWVLYQAMGPGHYIRGTDASYLTSWRIVEMNDEGADGDAEAADGVYTATLPPQRHRTLVRYLIYARDASPDQKEARALRESDPSKNYAYFVYNGVPPYSADITYLGQPRTHTVLTKLPVYHLIANDYDVLECEYKGISFGDEVNRSDYKWRGTFVYEGDVYDHICFRLRGGVWRYTWQKRSYKLKFNRGRRFVMKDNYGNPHPEKRKKLNLNANIQQNWTGKRGEEGMYESLGYRLFRDAGVRFSYTTWIHFRIIDGASEIGADQYKGDFYGIFTEIENPDDNLLKAHGHPLSGNLYKMEGGWDKEVNDVPPLDDSDMQAFWDGYHSVQPVQWWRDNFNLESWYSYHAIVDGIHHTDIHAGKNYYFYRNPETNLWEVFPWDLDLVFDVPYGGGDGPFVSPVLGAYPDVFGVEYKNRLREILHLIYTEEHIFPIIDEWRDLIIEMTEADRDRWDQMPLPDPYPFQGQLERTPWQNLFEPLDVRISGLKSWILNRRSTMLGWAQDANIPAKPVNQSPPDGAPAQGIPLLVSSAFSDPSGDPHAASRWIIIKRGADWAYPLWDSGDDDVHRVSIVVPTEVLENQEWYEWRVKHRDSTNRWSKWSDPTSFQARIVSDPTAPTSPAGLSAQTPDYETVVLSWAASTDPESGILGYEIKRDGVLLTTGWAQLSYTDDTAIENTSYRYEVIAINGGGTKSGPAQLHVTTPQDDVPPTVLSVEAAAQDMVRIVFSEPLNPETATPLVNYRLSDWVSVMSVTLQPDGQTVELTTTAMSHGRTYDLTVANIADASSLSNAIAPGTTLGFTTQFEVEIWDIRLSTGNTFIVEDHYAAGSYVYSDQLYYVVGHPIPAELSEGSIQIRLPNAPDADRNSKTGEYLTFNVSFDVEVWVGFRISETLPAWLADGTWEFTEFTQYVDKSGGARYHDFYRKVFHRGEVVLGGNAQDPASVHSNFIVVIRPLSAPDPDRDDDGMLDDWEIAWFGNVSRQPAADDDLDGKTNFEEFAAGTSPIDPLSLFDITQIGVNGEQVEVRWHPTSYKYYQVYYSSSPAGEWFPLGQPQDSGGGAQVDEDASSARQRYYRVEVW